MRASSSETTFTTVPSGAPVAPLPPPSRFPLPLPARPPPGGLRSLPPRLRQHRELPIGDVRPPPARLQRLQLPLQLLHVGEGAVHGGEADVGDVGQGPQPLPHP